MPRSDLVRCGVLRWISLVQKKRYQIFLSSTFSDLEEERRRVMMAMLGMDCIPSGMEFFPASDEETFEFIKTVIDESDYYILILAGRYGSVASDGKSYTEKEYDYAVSVGKPVLSFVIKDISQLTISKTDSDNTLAPKMSSFREKVLNSGRIAKFWANSDQLASEVILTLTHAIKRYPQPGWIKGDQAASSEILVTINKLREENDILKQKANFRQSQIPMEGLANLDDELEIGFEGNRNVGSPRRSMSIRIKLGDLLQRIGHTYRTPNVIKSREEIKSLIIERTSCYSIDLNQQYVRDIITHFEITGILEAKNSESQTFYVLTEKGLNEYLFRMAIKKTT